MPSGLLGMQTRVFYLPSMATSFHGITDAFAVKKLLKFIINLLSITYGPNYNLNIAFNLGINYML